MLLNSLMDVYILKLKMVSIRNILGVLLTERTDRRRAEGLLSKPTELGDFGICLSSLTALSPPAFQTDFHIKVKSA